MGVGHGHGHGPTGTPTAARLRRMRLSWLILVLFFALQLTVGLAINSLGLIADAGHMLTDIIGVSMGLIALSLVARGSTSRARTFGWHRAEVITALVNSALLIGVAVFVFAEAIDRIGSEPDIPGLPMVLTALAGLAANVAVVMLLRADAQESIAVRGAYLEVLADTVGSVAVLISGILVLAFGWTWTDIAVGVALSLWILPRAIKLGASALRILTQAGPSHIDVESVERDLHALPGVVDVHDLHVWTLTTGKDVATVHLTSDADGPAVLTAARKVLSTHGLEHATVQVETLEDGEQCREDLTW